MKKRIASVLVALVMVLSLVPKTSWAWTSTVTTYNDAINRTVVINL